MPWSLFFKSIIILIDFFLLLKSSPSVATLAKHIPDSIPFISINVVITIPFLGSSDLLQYLHISCSSSNNESAQVGEDLFPLGRIYGGINDMSYNYQWKWQMGSLVSATLDGGCDVTLVGLVLCPSNDHEKWNWFLTSSNLDSNYYFVPFKG